MGDAVTWDEGKATDGGLEEKEGDRYPPHPRFRPTFQKWLMALMNLLGRIRCGLLLPRSGP